MERKDVLLDGRWVAATGEYFDVTSPADDVVLGRFRRSRWAELDLALDAGEQATLALESVERGQIAAFLDSFAGAIAANASRLAAVTARETGLPETPRLADVEIPAMVDQLRQAAHAARSRSWQLPTLSPRQRIASQLAPIPGVAVIIGPNNFPYRFNAVGGGDFAAAVATGHAVLAKAHPLHPETSRLLAELAVPELVAAGLPEATVQLVYDMAAEDGLRLVADRRVAATAFTGSRSAGLALKAAADAAGKPIYLEMASLNPAVVLAGAAAADGERIGRELGASVANGMGQFCTCPSLIFTVGDGSASVVRGLIAGISAAPSHPMLNQRVASSADAAVDEMTGAGAEVVFEGNAPAGAGCAPRVLQVTGDQFRAHPEALQTEAFGPVTMVVTGTSIGDVIDSLGCLSGNLAGAIYAADGATDRTAYLQVEPVLRRRVGRLLNNKVPTGVSVTAAMNHGGPYPSTGHPGFTAVGMPASLRRFGMLRCYDNVRDEYLPLELQAANPLGIQRYVDGDWTSTDISWGDPPS